MRLATVNSTAAMLVQRSSSLETEGGKLLSAVNRYRRDPAWPRREWGNLEFQDLRGWVFFNCFHCEP